MRSKFRAAKPEVFAGNSVICDALQNSYRNESNTAFQAMQAATKLGLALARFVAFILLIDDVNAALPANELAVRIIFNYYNKNVKILKHE